MADDHPQRPFRNPSRATPTANNPSVASNDPLAELARLIGQNDPFGEFGRGNAQPGATSRPASPVAPAAQPVPGYASRVPPRDPYAAQEAYGAEDPARQPFGSAPLGGPDDLYQAHGPVPGYEDHAAPAAAYEDAGYDPNAPYDPSSPYAGGGHEYGDGHDYYDDVPPRRRMGVLAIAAVFALAVIGTAGAFGYRALFGSASSGPPPVIKADATPSKIVPDKDKDHAAKLINDRVNNPGGGQKLVSREEQPVDLNRDTPTGMVTQGQPVANAGAMQPAALGSGIIGPEPKKIHTITIRPDQQATPDANMAPAMAAASPEPTQPADQASAAPALAPAGQPARRVVSKPVQTPVSKPAPAPRQTVAHRPSPAPRRVAASRNAPLSLTPDAVATTARRAAPAAPTRLAPEPARSSMAPASGSYAVQVSSRRSQADAQAALNRMQSRFAGVLGGQQVMVRRVDLGAKGVYYRAMVGPFESSEAAGRLCSRLKAAGGSCFVQRI